MDGSRAVLSLPGVYSACAGDRIATFPALRPHQAPAWHAFLVQVAVMGCEALELDAPPGDDVAAWTRVLRALTPDWPEDEPWRLVTPHGNPAFFQPPTPSGTLDGFKDEVIRTPDALDMLVTAKNHDVKAERIGRPQADDWVFALVSLQTQEGYMGRGKYGIARMNGGHASRPYMRLAPNGAFGRSAMRDVRAMLNAGDAWRPPNVFATRSAVPLAWVKPWDGEEQLDLADLHPLFVECCRRIRFRKTEDGLVCRFAGSEGARVAARELNGALGDPWAPIDITDAPKALKITEEGFSYRKAVELLFSGGRTAYARPFLAHRHAQEGALPMRYEFAALARGEGKTEGFHVRTIAAPAEAIDRIEDGAASRLAWERVGQAGDAWSKALRAALIVLYQGGPDDPDWRNPATGKLADAWRAAFDARVDQVFFAALWEGLSLDQDEAARAWAETLADIARDVFSAAKAAAPQRAERRFLAEARASDLLQAALRKALPALRTRKETTDAE